MIRDGKNTNAVIFDRRPSVESPGNAERDQVRLSVFRMKPNKCETKASRSPVERRDRKPMAVAQQSFALT